MSAMNATSRISRSRSAQGSRPRTFSSPSYGTRPRIALSAVVLPAPLGPMSPRMRPSSRRRFTPSSATVLPNAFRSPRASIDAIRSALLLSRVRRGRGIRWRSIQQFFPCEPEALGYRLDPGQFFGQELPAFQLEQPVVRAVFDEHAEPPLLLHQ